MQPIGRSSRRRRAGSPLVYQALSLLACLLLQGAAAQDLPPPPQPDPRILNPLIADEVIVKFAPSTGVGTASVNSLSTDGMVASTARLSGGGTLAKVKLEKGESMAKGIARLSSKRGVVHVVPNVWVHGADATEGATLSAVGRSTASVASLAGVDSLAGGLPDYTKYPFFWPEEDRLMNDAWAFEKVSMGYAWGKGLAGNVDARVCLVDSGIDFRHPDLLGLVDARKVVSFVDNEKGSFTLDATYDDDGHGTKMAGVMAARRNGRGITGAMFGGIDLYVCKFMGADGFGTTHDAYLCLDWCINKVGAVISINAWGSDIGNAKWDLSQPAYAPERAFSLIADLLAKNLTSHLFVAAAGNQRQQLKAQRPGGGKPFFFMPAQLNLQNMLVVGATDRRDLLWDSAASAASLADNDEDSASSLAAKDPIDTNDILGSNYGSNWVSVAAPGFQVVTTRKVTPTQVAAGDDRFWVPVSGTSIATALVGATAGLVYAADNNPASIDMLLIRDAILEGADVVPALRRTLPDGQQLVAGGRRLNAYGALDWYFESPEFPSLPPELVGRRKQGLAPPPTTQGTTTKPPSPPPPRPRPPPPRPPPPKLRPIQKRPPPPKPRPSPRQSPPPPRFPPPRPSCGFAMFWDGKRCKSCTVYRLNCMECNTQRCLKPCTGNGPCKPPSPPPKRRWTV